MYFACCSTANPAGGLKGWRAPRRTGFRGTAGGGGPWRLPAGLGVRPSWHISGRDGRADVAELVAHADGYGVVALLEDQPGAVGHGLAESGEELGLGDADGQG